MTRFEKEIHLKPGIQLELKFSERWKSRRIFLKIHFFSDDVFIQRMFFSDTTGYRPM